MSNPYAEVIGDPIAHSKSPLIHNFWLGKLGIDAEYRVHHVKPEALEEYFEHRRGDPNWLGCNITAPHKQNARFAIDGETNAAASVGAVNTVLPHQAGLAGHNSDVRGVRVALGDVEDKAIALIGNGGAARAALAQLRQDNAAEVRIVARDIEKSKALLEDFGLDGHALAFGKENIAFDGVERVINATPLGMAGSSPMPSSAMRALSHTTQDALVFDMIYAPLETPLLKAAVAFERTTVDGLVMLVEQAREAFFLFFQDSLTEESEAILASHNTELRELLVQ